MHTKGGMVHCGCKHQIPIGQLPSLTQQHVAAFEIDTLIPNIPSFGG